MEERAVFTLKGPRAKLKLPWLGTCRQFFISALHVPKKIALLAITSGHADAGTIHLPAQSGLLSWGQALGFKPHVRVCQTS